MPYSTAWVEPAVFLTHNRVRVFCTYKDDDVEQGPNKYCFTLRDLCGEQACACDEPRCLHVFDVRELPNWAEAPHPPYLTGEYDTPENRQAWEAHYHARVEERHIEGLIRAALDHGWLVPPAGSEMQVVQASPPKNPLVGANLKRAGWARQALEVFMTETGLSEADDFDTAMGDLLCDLQHLAIEFKLDFQELLTRAEFHHSAETGWTCARCGRNHDAETDGAEETLCVECAGDGVPTS